MFGKFVEFFQWGDPDAIIVQLPAGAGIGNQLSTYFGGLYLSTKLQRKLIVDVSLVEEASAQFGLIHNFLHIPGLFRNRKTEHLFLFLLERLTVGLTHKYGIRVLQTIRRSFTSIRFGFDPLLGTASPGSLIRGYFQSFRYFDSLDIKLENGIEFQEKLVDDEVLSFVSRDDVAVFHIRLGDYELLSETFGNLGAQYYLDALSFFGGQCQDVFVVSNNDKKASEWAQLFLGPTIKVHSLPSRTPEEDFQIMTHSSNLVISNSTFSWWAG